MKILIISNLYPPHFIGGYERGCLDVVEELEKRGHEVWVLTSRYGVKSAREDGRVIRRLRELFSARSWYVPFLLPFWERENQRILAAVMDRIKPEVVYFWNMAQVSISAVAQVGERGLPAAWYLSDEVITSVEETDLWLRCVRQEGRGLTGRLAAQAMRWFFRGQIWRSRWPLAALPELHCTSRFIAGKVASSGLNVDRMAVIPWGVASSFTGKLPAARSIPDEIGKIRFLFAGRLVADKGAMTALRAFVQFSQKTPEFTADFKMAGGGEPAYIESLTSAIRAAGMEQRIMLAGKVTRDVLREMYLEADIYVFPSEWNEPFAISPLEAMASGCAVIGTTTGGSGELFHDGENALTYEAGDVAGLAECMKKLAQNFDLRHKLAEAGRRKVIECYTKTLTVDRIEARLKALAENAIL